MTSEILIVEDEMRAASELLRLLRECNFNHTLLGIIDTVEEAVIWFEQHKAPDLVFMDVQLADGLSFDIFQNVEIRSPIIFTTTFDQYAIQAFKVNSVDYLLKPIQKSDLDNALDKFNRINKWRAIDHSMIKQIVNRIQPTFKREGILVRVKRGFVQINVSDLLYCYSEDSVTFGVTKDKRHVINETMDELFGSLDFGRFYRINRSQIVAKKAIERIEPYFNQRIKLSVQKSEGRSFIVTRQKTKDFKEWMNR